MGGVFLNEDLTKRVSVAKENKQELERLLIDYLPFIKKKMSETTTEDFLTISMLAFASSVEHYEESRGNFLSFAALNIRCRILDELKKENRYFNKTIPIYNNTEIEDNYSPAELELSLKQYDRDQERKTISEEIQIFSAELSHYGITFSELTKCCPKHKKTRELCIDLSRYVINNDILKQNLQAKQQLPQSKLAADFKISVKTVEKHRKFIISVVILLLGDYPHIKTFIPTYREVGNR